MQPIDTDIERPGWNDVQSKLDEFQKNFSEIPTSIIEFR